MDPDEERLLELQVLQKEYEWVLHDEFESVVTEIQVLLTETFKNFASDLYTEQESRGKAEKFLLSAANNIPQAKCMVTLVGGVIYEADVALKLQKQSMVPYQTRIYAEHPWRLQQIQDAGNHLQQVLFAIESRNPSAEYTSGHVLNLLDEIMDGVRCSRDSLLLPRRRTLDDLMKNPALKAFKPALPNDALVSFYIQAQKLVLTVYHLVTQYNKTDIVATYKLEVTVPWLSNTLTLLTDVLQKCQLIKDKITMFTQYDDDFRKLTSLNSNSTTIDEGLDFLGHNPSKKAKSTNPFLNSPDEETAPLRETYSVKHEAIFSSDDNEVTWM